jgi:hypothetical protein
MLFVAGFAVDPASGLSFPLSLAALQREAPVKLNLLQVFVPGIEDAQANEKGVPA